MGVKFYWSGFYKGDTFYCVLFKLKGCKLHISEGIKVMGKLHFLEEGQLDSLSDGNLCFAVHWNLILSFKSNLTLTFVQCFLPNRQVGRVYGKTKIQWQLLRHVESFCCGARNLFSTVSKENRHKTGIKCVLLNIWLIQLNSVYYFYFLLLPPNIPQVSLRNEESNHSHLTYLNFEWLTWIIDLFFWSGVICLKLVMWLCIL